MTTKISWTDETWNPTVGCARVSPGCVNCYAEHAAAMVNRTQGEASVYRDMIALVAGRDPRWNGKAKFLADRLSIPLGWRKPRRVFVDSMSDLFHDDIANEQIAAIFGVMAATPRHTYQVLTKRPKRMVEWFRWATENRGMTPYVNHETSLVVHAAERYVGGLGVDCAWPLPNVWLGVSVENQDAAEERIPLLLQSPAAVRFLSCEPLIGAVDLHAIQIPDAAAGLRFSALQEHHDDRYGSPPAILSWVIAGCESGHGARPCESAWLRSLRDQCKAASVAFFLKQATAEGTPDGANEHECTVLAGPGSHRKGGGVIELPYLDGVQHAAFPDAPNA